MNQARPPGWTIVRVGDLVKLDNGFAFKPTDWKKSGLPIIRIQNLNNPEAAYNYCDREVPVRVLVSPGDLLFAWSGTPGTSFGAHIWRGEKAVLNQHIFNVRFDDGSIDRKFLRLAINQNLVEYIRAAHGGAGLAHITKGRFEQSQLLLPPLHEQIRIVAKIEELFSDLDAGVAALERVRANLKRYRAAVLKAAVEGHLTKEWRKQHPATEAAVKLLERILAERRAKWEQDQLRKFKEAGKTPSKGWKEKYEEPGASSNDAGTLLPPTWCWATLEQLTIRGPQNGVYYPKSQYGRGTPIIRIDDYQNDSSRTASELQLVEAPAADVETYGVRVGDIIINRVNSITHLGKCLVIEPKHLPAVFESNMMRQSLASDVVPTFAALYLKSGVGNSRLIANAKWAVNQASINQTDVGNTPVPLPPFAEQAEIVAEVDRRLSVAAAAEQQVEHALQRASRLRQAILKRAFEGKLVPQDPSDEPAAALLARAKASSNGHRAVIKTSVEPHATPTKRRSRARA
ncbi:MAG: hypothetical protein AMXMBFR58_24570 [Phycisphaerae bacterium]